MKQGRQGKVRLYRDIVRPFYFRIEDPAIGSPDQEKYDRISVLLLVGCIWKKIETTYFNNLIWKCLSHEKHN